MGHICDWCSDPHPRFVYETEAPLAQVAWHIAFDAKWGACEACAAIIDRPAGDARSRAERMAALLDRAQAPMWGVFPPEFLAIMRAQLRAIYEQFFATLRVGKRRVSLEEVEREPRPPSFGDVALLGEPTDGVAPCVPIERPAAGGAS